MAWMFMPAPMQLSRRSKGGLSDCKIPTANSADVKILSVFLLTVDELPAYSSGVHHF
jgi:hypothetical protein